MICELVRSGRRVGITALSHKVIRNLLEEVIEAAAQIWCVIASVAPILQRLIVSKARGEAFVSPASCHHL